MRRRLLRDRLVVDDDWEYFQPGADVEGTDAETADAEVRAAARALIIPLDLWLKKGAECLARSARLGVLLQPADTVELLAPHLSSLQLVAAAFPGASEGRGYSQARILRERYAFSGELRATGYVRQDQLFLLARCGFNSFELPDADLEAASAALATFSAAYQASNDLGLPAKLSRYTRR